MSIAAIAEVMEFNADLFPPEGISPRAKQAYDVIIAFLIEQDLTFTGGCKVFSTPEEWQGEYGKNSLLVILYEGADVGDAFSYDRERYSLIEALDAKLAEIGLFSEQCTSYYSAVYEIG